MINVPVSFTCNDLICNWFCKRNPTHRIEKEWNDLGYSITVLPVDASRIDMTNLYPTTNRVERWNVFVVGSDMTFILANTGTMSLNNEGADKTAKIAHALLNTTGSILDLELQQFLRPVLQTTLEGKPLQFFVVISADTFFVNTFPLVHANGKVVGAVIFLRATGDAQDPHTAAIRRSLDI